MVHYRTTCKVYLKKKKVNVQINVGHAGQKINIFDIKLLPGYFHLKFVLFKIQELCG